MAVSSLEWPGLVEIHIFVSDCRAAGVFRSTATLGVLAISVCSPTTTRRDSVATLTDDKKIVLRRIVLKLSGPCNIAQTCILCAWRIVPITASWVDWCCTEDPPSWELTGSDHVSSDIHDIAFFFPPRLCFGEKIT